MNEAAKNSGARSSGRPKTRVTSKKAAVLYCCAKAVVFTAVGTLVLMLACAAIYNNADNPDVFIKPTAYTLLIASSLACGIISAKLCGGDGLLCGLCSGLMLLALLLLLSVIFGTEQRGVLSDVIMAAAVLFICCVGGIVGRKQKTRKISRHKKQKNNLHRRK